MGDNGTVKPKEVEKETRLSVRIEPALKRRLHEAVDKMGVDEPTIVRQCLIAFCEHVEMHGRVMFPVTIGSPSPKASPPPDRLELNEELLYPKRKAS